MPEDEFRYLKIFGPNGDWISRPDYYILATIFEPELETALHTYYFMLREDELRLSSTENKASQFVKRMEGIFTNKSLYKQREIAGHVMFELVRIAAVTGKSPSLVSAYHLAAHWYQAEYGHGIQKSADRIIRRHFKTFRDTVHLLAAFVYEPNLVEDLEGDEKSLRRFLRLAKGFEQFFDNNVTKTEIPWNPYRIPQQIEPIYSIRFDGLTHEERDLL